MVKQIVMRINYSTYLKFRRHFLAKRKESMVSYFKRLADWLEDVAEDKIVW